MHVLIHHRFQALRVFLFHLCPLQIKKLTFVTTTKKPIRKQTIMKDSTILPLFAPQMNDTQRYRQRGVQWSMILRYAIRRRLKFYLVVLALITVVAITLIHKISNRNLKIDENDDHGIDRARFEARTMKTIIGKYVGPKPNWSDLNAQNISVELLNSNNYDPDPEIGKDGRPAYLPGFPKDQMKLLYSINRFNLAASDKISVDRKLPDARKGKCCCWINASREFKFSQSSND